jgi:hypothetical protein
MHKVRQDHVPESRKLANEHAVRRDAHVGFATQLRGLEEGLKRERDEMNARHAKGLKEITDKHDREFERLK